MSIGIGRSAPRRMGLALSHKRRGTVEEPPPEDVTLSALSLSAATVAEGTGAGATVGSILGKSSGSTLSLVDDAGGRFAISGVTLVTGATATDYETATSHNVTVRETLTGATNTPRDTVLAVTVTDEVDAMGDLFPEARGGYWDPSDLSTLFQDVEGQTPVTTAGQSVALMLDKSRLDGRGFVNRFVWSEDFSQSVWTKTNATASGQTFTETTTNGLHGLSQGVGAVTSGQSYTVSAVLSAVTRRYVQLYGNTDWTGGTSYAAFDLQTGAVSAQVGVTASITDLGGGRYRCSCAIPATATIASATVNIRTATAATGRGQSFAGSTSAVVTVEELQFENGASRTAYQKNTRTLGGPGAHLVQATSGQRPTYQTTGAPHLALDGVDDTMAGTMDLTGALDIAFGVAARMTGNADTGFALSVAGPSSTPSTSILMPTSGAPTTARLRGNNGALVTLDNTLALNADAAYLGLFQPASSLLALRRDGSQVASTASSMGSATGSFGATATVNLGDGGAPLEGRWYGGAVLGRAPTSDDIATLDAWLMSKLPA